MTTTDSLSEGYTILRDVVSAARCESMAREIESLLTSQSDGAIETSRRGLVAGRNLMHRWNGWREITQRRPVAALIQEQVGFTAGLVRILYFDKPPGQSWALSLHRDKTIAVAEHHDPCEPFGKPTRKAGVPHVEATDQLLSRMLTLRLHLDPMKDANGPLFVVPGSHRELSQTSRAAAITIHCEAGDLFVMRPLLLHGSHAAASETKLHRRVVHLEFAPSRELPSPYQWHRFFPLTL